MPEDAQVCKQMSKADELRTLAHHELDFIWPYLYRGKPTSKFPMVIVDFDGEWPISLPLLMCLEKDYGHLCIFHSDFCLALEGDAERIQFDIGVHRYTSNEFHVICSSIDDSHPGFCFISYALVAICHRQALIDIALSA